MKRALLSLYRKLILHRWNIGFVSLEDTNLFNKEYLDIKWVKHNYKDRWFADPFLLNVTDSKYEVLVEEFFDPIQRGRISKLVIDRKSLKLLDLKVLLELDSHLSFPAIHKYKDKVFIYPENSATDQLVLYKYDLVTETLNPEAVLIHEPLTDAIISMDFGKPVIFSTKIPNQNKEILSIYESDSWNGPYALTSTIMIPDCSARGAGRLMNYQGKLLRPAQDCNGSYGRGLVFQEVKRNDDGTFVFNEIKRFLPHSWKYHSGMHTFDSFLNIGVVDGRGYRNPILGHILGFIRSLIIKNK